MPVTLDSPTVTFHVCAGTEGILEIHAVSEGVSRSVADLLPLAVLAPGLVVQGLVADALAHPAQVCPLSPENAVHCVVLGSPVRRVRFYC